MDGRLTRTCGGKKGGNRTRRFQPFNRYSLERLWPTSVLPFGSRPLEVRTRRVLDCFPTVQQREVLAVAPHLCQVPIVRAIWIAGLAWVVGGLRVVPISNVDLSLPKMLCGANAFKISDQQLEPRYPGDRIHNVTCPAAGEITIRQPEVGIQRQTRLPAAESAMKGRAAGTSSGRPVARRTVLRRS